MAWNDHPQGQRGYFWMHKPQAVFQSQLDYANTVASGKVSGEDIYQYLYVSSITLGALSDLREGMTLSLGSAAGGWNYGFCQVLGVINVSGTDVIRVWVGGATEKAGDLHIASGTKYITVWKEFRLWSKPPYYDDNGIGWYSGLQSNGVGGTNYNHPPVANGGPPVMGLASSGVLSVGFSARKSFRVEHTAVLGSWSADKIGNTLITADSYSGGNLPSNVADGNTATYWEPSGALNQGIQFYFTSGGANHPIYRIDITASGNYAPKTFQIKVIDNNFRGYSEGYYLVAEIQNETAWGSHETRSFYIDVDHDNEVWGTTLGTNPPGNLRYYWEIDVLATNGSTLRIEEVGLYEEDRTGGATQAYTWDFADGTITSGTVNSEAPTVSFPPGFRYVSLTVEDTNGYTDVHWIPVLVLDDTAHNISYSGATYNQSSYVAGYQGSYAFDGTGLYWRANATTGWVSATLAAARIVGGYSVQCNVLNRTRASKDWTLEYYDGANWIVADTQTGQTAWQLVGGVGETRSFVLERPIMATAWRLNVSANDGGASYLEIAEIVLKTPADVSMDVEVTQRELSVEGQQLDVVIHEDISGYPDGALVMFGQQEWFAGTAGAVSQAEHELVDRAFLKFWGWIESEEPAISSSDTGWITSTRVTCLDIGRKLATLPGWNLVFQRKYSPSYSYEMRHPTLDRLVWFVLRYLSNAVNLTEFYWSGSGEWYGCGVIGIYGADLFSMVDGRCRAMGHLFTCNRFGRLRMRKDQNLITSSLRDGGAHVALTESDYTEIGWSHTIDPRFNSLWANAILTNAIDHDGAGFAVVSKFCVAPGQVPIQGVQQIDQGEQVVSQREGNSELKRREANRFENRLSPTDSGFTLALAGGNDIGIDPAEMRLETVALGAAYAAERGQTLTAQKFYALRVVHTYDHEGMYANVTLEAEKYGVASYNALEYDPDGEE